MERVRLRQWQKKFVKFAKSVWQSGYRGLYLAADIGTGKTIAAIAAAKALGYNDLAVIAPLSAHPSWIEDGKKLGFTFELNKNLFTYEKLARNNIVPYADLIIYDEAHRVKNHKAKITKLLLKYHKNQPKFLLSGTPQDKLHELYTQYKLIDPYIWGNYSSYTKWVTTFFVMSEYFKPKALRHPAFKDEILKNIDPVTFRVRLDEVTEIPEAEEIPIKLKPSKQLQKKINAMRNEEFYQLGGFIKEYAMAQGIDPETGEIIDTTKLDWVLDFLKDNPDTIVFSYFKTPVRWLEEKLKDNAYYVTGDDKKDLKDAIEKGDKPIIATFALKEGANLQKYKKAVFLSLPLSYRDYFQSKGRIHRSGQTDKVLIYKLMKQPIDYEVDKILKNKKELNDYVRNREYLQNIS